MSEKKQPIALEDNFEDILNKAMRGLGLDSDTLSSRTGVPAETITKILGGEVDDSGIRALSSAMGLVPERVVSIATKNYRPAEIEMPSGYADFQTQFGDMQVNSYLVWDEVSKEAVAFDTGTDVSKMFKVLSQHELDLRLILITHSHKDHVLALPRLVEKTGAPVWAGEKEALEGMQSFTAGHTFRVGRLQIQTRLTKGHCAGGITFVVDGLDRRLAIVGDAIFAGSMGGGMVSYRDALETGRKEIFSLTDDTVICPGHGPLTTVGEQKKANPFFPDL